MLIILTSGASSSCSDISLEGLVIESDQVYADFTYPSQQSGACTGDFNVVTFFFIVDRQALPEDFTLMVSRELDSCESCFIEVDLADEEALEFELWGQSVLALAMAGTPPADGTFNVIQWTWADQVGALLLSASEWRQVPSSFQSFAPGADVGRIDGFVTSCDAEQCDECEGETCDELPRLGTACTRSYEPIAYQDQTFIVTFNGTSCSIEVEAGMLEPDP